MFPSSFLIIATLAHLPVVFMYSKTMWGRGHYQFFPLLFCGVAWLLYDRLSNRNQDGSQGRLAIVLFLFNLIVLFFAIAIHTPVLVIPAVILLLLAVIVDRYGLAGLWATIPVVGILIIVMKMPTGRDLVLINQMQFLASQLASWILDAFGLVHFREGVILVTEKKQFFTEEACSGIRSLFSTIAAVAIYGLVRRYSTGRQIFNLAQSIVWVIAGNAIRVAAIVFLSDNGYEHLAEGNPHEIFGLFIFIGILGITLSVDRALDVFKSDQGHADLADKPAPTKTDDDPSTSSIAVTRSRLASWGLMGVYLLVFLFSARLTYAKWNNFDKIDFKATDLAAMEGSELPDLVQGWTLKKFESKFRTEASLFAPESYVWAYKQENLSAVVSLDSPYPEFHDLTLCYQGVGWNVKTHHEYPENSDDGFSWLEMTKPGEFGRVYFAAYTPEGRIAQPAYEFSPTTRVIRNIELATGKLAIPKGDVNRNGELLPITQVQLLVSSDQPISEADIQRCRDLFDFSRSKLLETVRFRN